MIIKIKSKLINKIKKRSKLIEKVKIRSKQNHLHEYDNIKLQQNKSKLINKINNMQASKGS